ncbi:hypothetical protein ACOVJN_04495 [Scardovia wiggsiae]|uniref:hypothetical protein n=1 Tax=Scardovia wiggsiae TaxID=230143 RepID=UPI003BA968C5
MKMANYPYIYGDSLFYLLHYPYSFLLQCPATDPQFLHSYISAYLRRALPVLPVLWGSDRE